MARTITSADVSFTITIPGVFPAPQTIQGFATDDILSTSSVKPAETMMGADGKFSAGWVPVETVMAISLQADSDSALVFDAWFAAQQPIKGSLQATAVIIFSQNDAKYNLFQGVLTGIQPIGGARKTMSARPFEITWGQIIRVPA